MTKVLDSQLTQKPLQSSPIAVDESIQFLSGVVNDFNVGSYERDDWEQQKEEMITDDDNDDSEDYEEQDNDHGESTPNMEVIITQDQWTIVESQMFLFILNDNFIWHTRCLCPDIKKPSVIDLERLICLLSTLKCRLCHYWLGMETLKTCEELALQLLPRFD